MGSRPDRSPADGGLRAHPVSWALWDVLQTADQAEHVVASHLGLPYTDARALSHVLTSPVPIGPVELGRRVGISSASATVLADRLVGSGHLRRRPHPDDKRRKVLVATAKGHAAAVQALRPLLADLDQIVYALSDHEVTVVTRYLLAVAEAQRSYGP